MNYLKRSFFSVLHNPQNTIFTLLIFFLLATLILSSFCILEQSQQYMEEMRQSVYTSVTLTSDAVESEDLFYGKNTLSLQQVLEIAEKEAVKDVKVQALSLAEAAVGLRPYETEQQQEKYGENRQIRVEGAATLFELYAFQSEEFALLSGEDVEGKENGAVISQKVSQRSHLDVGDTFTLRALYKEADQNTYGETELEVVGIYTVDIDPSYSEPAYMNSENIVYVLPETVYTLNAMDKVSSAEFVIKDPLSITGFIDEIQAEGYDSTDRWNYLINDMEYRKLRNMIGSINSIMYLMLCATIILGGIILFFMTMISLRKRDFEMGVLLSVGENRAKIILQLVIESLVPVLLAMVLAVFTGPPVSQMILDFIGESMRTEIILTSGPVLLLFACGIGLTLLASLFTLYKVLFYQPKKVLAAID